LCAADSRDDIDEDQRECLQEGNVGRGAGHQAD
jgi:hypothetical protein